MDFFRNIMTDEGVKMLCEQINNMSSLVNLKIFFSGLNK